MLSYIFHCVAKLLHQDTPGSRSTEAVQRDVTSPRSAEPPIKETL